MDLATIFGIVFSLLLVGLALGDVANFLNPAGMLIVLGGTFGAMLTNFPLQVVARAFGLIRKTFAHRPPDTRKVAEQFMEYAYIARREGILALEPLIKDLESPFMRKGMHILVDGLEPQAISKIMETEIENTESRHAVGVDLLNALAAYAPALGLIGTVIGLVRMLSNMTDPTTIGPAMAIALLTTFYGAMLANLVFLPLCGKLKNRTKAEVFIMEMQLAGILGIARGENPRLIREILECYQEPAERADALP